MVMCYLVAILGFDIEKATHLVDELEQVGLIRFDELGNFGLLVIVSSDSLIEIEYDGSREA